jgi:hypothetical protein
VPIRQDPIKPQISDDIVNAFGRTVSIPRWKTYMRAAGFRPDVAGGLYLWNVAIGQAFHFPLQAVEVALRNVINHELCKEFGADWWKTLECLRYLEPERVADIDKVSRRIRRKYGTEPFTDQLVASLTLGFWAAMLKREYNARLWDKHVGSAFPHLAAPHSIRTVSGAANAIQDLRNRIFHHEPLIGRALSDDYGQVLRMLGWICPATRDWVKLHSSVPIVLRQRPR